ncbi:MAG: hypothetical protein J0M08_09965 [Bacteroidetes bacterium]|nr:hypothetical protein [Bacteroidota bacterium]
MYRWSLSGTAHGGVGQGGGGGGPCANKELLATTNKDNTVILNLSNII